MKISQLNTPQINSVTLLLGLYQRVSTDEQAQVVEGSMDNQRHRLQAFIEIKNLQEPGWGRIVENYVDDGYSAKDTNRPGYQRMMKDLKSGRINAIMVTELSRLSRNIPDFCDFHKVIDGLGAKFLAIKENFDSSTPAGKMMLFNMINLAQFEREQISERVAINCHSRSMRGLLSGGPVILGYDRVETNKTTFTVNETEAAHVQKIFSTFLEQRTIGRTIIALETLGIKPKGKKSKKSRLINEGRWTVDSLSFVLQNKSYIGIKEVNKNNKNKEPHKLKAWQKYTEVKASWPAIIDEATFSEVQKIIQENREKERARLETSEERVFLAAQVCKCGQCGRALVGQSAHGRNKVHRYYVHSSKKGDVINCGFKRIRADKIESKIVDYLSEILVLAGYFNKVSENIRKAITVKPEVIKAEKNRLTLELQKLNTAIKNTFRIQAELDPQSEAIRVTAAELNDLSRKKALIEAEIEKVKLQEAQESDVESAIDDLKSRLEAFRRGWKKSTATARKALIKDLIYGIIVNPSSGLSIQFRLSGSLNSDATTPLVSISEESQKNVIDLENRRPQQQPTADAGTTEGGQSYNLGIFGSQVVEFGSEGRT